MPAIDVFKYIDQELKKNKVSRRELARILDVPESSLSTAFARKSRSFLFKDDRIEKIAKVLNTPIWSLLYGIPANQLRLSAGTLYDEKGEIILDSIAITNLFKRKCAARILNDLLHDIVFADFLYAIDGVKEALDAGDKQQYRAELYNAHKAIELIIDDWKRQQEEREMIEWLEGARQTEAETSDSAMMEDGKRAM